MLNNHVIINLHSIPNQNKLEKLIILALRHNIGIYKSTLTYTPTQTHNHTNIVTYKPTPTPKQIIESYLL